MQPKFTFRKTGFIFKLIPLLIISLGLFVNKINAQCTWSASTNYPVNILDQPTVTVGNNLYTFAGVSNGAIVSNSYKFDGTTWTAIAPLPSALEFPAAVTDGTNIFILGGANSVGTPTTLVYRYNVASNNYTTLASFTTGVWNHSAVFLNGKIYKFCGTGPGTASTNALEIYDVAANTWSTGANYPIAVSFVSAVAVGNFIYAAGGIQSTGGETLKGYRYDPATNTWDDPAMADLPATRWGSAQGLYNGFFVMAGGYMTGAISNSAIMWDPVGNSWSALPAMGTGNDRARMTGAVLSGSFYVIGGRSTAVGGFTGTNSNQKLSCNFTACSGTPNPGNTLSTANPACPNVNFTLSLQVTQGTGTTNQWQSSPNGTTWTNIPGATGSTYTTSQTVATYYRDSVRCTASGQFAYSNFIQITMNPPSACYCQGGAIDQIDEKISRVRFNTINNASNSQVGYQDFTNISTTLIQAGTYRDTVDVSNYFGGDSVRVWIDWNQNGLFTDPGELFYTSLSGTAQFSGNVTVPLTATLGPTRMRIRLYWAPTDPNPGPCGNTSYGQVEDYTVNIAPCITGVFTTQPSNTSAQCGSTVTLTAVNTGSVLTYRWEYRTSSSGIWFNVPNAAPYSGVFTNSLTITDVPSTLNGYQYRLVVVGPCTATDFSTPATLTVTPLVAVVNPSSATICTGTIQRLSIANQLGAPPVQSACFASGPISLPVPDFTTNGVNHSIPVSLPTGSVIVGARVIINMTHTWDGDMVFVLKGPNGQILNLDYYLSGTGGAGATTGFVNTTISSTGTAALSSGTNPYTGTFKADAQVTAGAFGPAGPNGYLPTTNLWTSLFSTANGNWTLAMYDGGPADLGVLTSWTICFDYTAPTFATGIWTSNPATPNTMWLNSGATIPYAGTPEDTIWVNPTVNTVYTVVVTTPTPCVSGPTNVTVNVTNPITNLTIPATKSACVGDNATITATANGGPITWQWQVSDNGGVTYTNISGATSATLTLNNVSQLMNNYRYRVTATASPCGSVSSTGFTTLIVNPLPTITLTANPSQVMPGVTTFVTASSTPAGASYTWTLNGVPITGATTSSVFADVDRLGSYKVTVTDVNGCVRTSAELVISAKDNPRLFIYPNPNNGQFQARLYSPAIYLYDVHTIRIFNSAGAVMLTKTFPISSQYVRMDFDMRGYAGGVYVARVSHNFTGKTVSARFVIQH